MSARQGPIDYSGLASALLARVDVLLSELFPDGRFQGREFVVGNLQGEHGKSLKVNRDTGRWSDFARDAKGGDLISLVAAIKGIKQSEAARLLAQEIGFSLSPDGAPKRSANGGSAKPEQTIIQPPVGTPPPSMHHSRHDAPSMSWCYRDAIGEVMFYVARYETSGGKQFVPWCWDGLRWIPKGWPEPRPLYGLDLLAKRPGAPVLVVEGEKAADAARVIVGDAYVVVSWHGGAAAWRKTDWSSLSGRKVLLWPDADRHAARANREAK